jgi:hypothetical protein
MQKAQIKQLRLDARRLETIAKHLRERARDIANCLRADIRAEQTRANFYSKQAKVDSGVPLIPRLSGDLFKDGE